MGAVRMCQDWGRGEGGGESVRVGGQFVRALEHFLVGDHLPGVHGPAADSRPQTGDGAAPHVAGWRWNSACARVVGC
jgi:hypothetical protein